jgi:hypothetical protein
MRLLPLAGRPRRVFRRDEALNLRASAMNLRTISRQLGIPLTTVREACAEKVPKSA